MKKIKSILIANRGEIAIRISETAKKMGIKTYGIKTPKEPGAYYLQFMDEIIDFTEAISDIPEFLDIDRIIYSIKEFNIDAVHPGYGYLAENPYFAQKCIDEKITFIGPSPDSIYKLGNKTIAKQLASRHNIPLLEGSDGNIKNTKHAKLLAQKIGYPVILKAASGGGGRGMRIVESEDSIEKMFRMAQNESEKAFADPSVFMEKYVRNPRHIEFQILADHHGNIIHLGERECSIQRKHQKLIEEAPSIALNDELREKMGESAINIARASNYRNAGTVEFLLDESGNFYFMEMNTRIQVEHPVTEMVTGLDLIEWQIRIAQEEKLTIKQKDVKIEGWAIECRINAEDVQSGFSPFLGTVEKISITNGKNCRFDTGVAEGSNVTSNFDSMLAKLICYGETREKAISNSLSALSKLQIQGIKTTIPFCKAVLNHPKFIKGDISTSFIVKDMKQLFHQEQDEEMIAAFWAALNYNVQLDIEDETYVDYEKGKNMTPWLMNKRLKSL
ncbi:MAG: ATP-grasp domain-containing protein [Bacteroidales bacterium]|nr:ATP-grasp domain-containing protein [Bacteroidales bacterium]